MGQADSSERQGHLDYERRQDALEPDVEWLQLGRTKDPIERKAQELFDRLVGLEAELADPQHLEMVGRAYARLSAWSKEHMWDADLGEVLEQLQITPEYPPWRRQALEEAYRLFYDEMVQFGDRQLMADLPEPPTSEEIGFRRLPEAIVSGAAVQEPLFQGVYEDRNTCPINRRRWEYEIHKTKGKNQTAGGRSIVGAKQNMATDSCAVGVVSNMQVLQRITQAFANKECCARSDEARKMRGPFFLPAGFHAKPLRPPGFEPSLSDQAPAWRLPSEG